MKQENDEESFGIMSFAIGNLPRILEIKEIKSEKT
jgi:hypothetical protein